MKKAMILIFIQLLMSAFISANTSINDLLQQNTRSMPVQMDMSTENGITICTGDKKSVGCRDGANMAVTNAFWGRISDKVCPSDDGDPVTDCDASPDTLMKVKGYCEGKKECDLIAKHEKLQKNNTSHCPGVNKYLVVNYTCIPESRGVTLCQDVGTTLTCDAGWVMELADVFWGRRANNAAMCGDDDGIECDNSESASKYLKNKCNNRRSCHIKANPDVLSNKKSSPCVGKYLMVNYICRPSTVIDNTDAKTTTKEGNKMQDSNSKELMGLLEKHLTEIKDTTPASKTEGTGKGFNNVPVAIQPNVVSVAVQPNIAQPNNFPLSGTSAGHVRSMEEERPKKIEEEKKQETEKKSETVKTEIEKNTMSGKGKTSLTESASSQEDDSTSVRSILTRAKDILKTLDMDGSQLRKRQFIARPNNPKSPGKTAAKKSIVAPKQQQQQQLRVYGQNKQQQIRRSNIPYYQPFFPENFRLRSWYGK